MEYLKPHLSILQQVALLTQRGLEGDASLLATRLKNVGYYRFSAYLHPFRIRNLKGIIEENYVPGTTLNKVWALEPTASGIQSLAGAVSRQAGGGAGARQRASRNPCWNRNPGNLG